MEPIKDKDKVARMFSQGQTTFVDSSSGYKYHMVACCPQDSSFSPVERQEKSSEGLSKVIFRCPNCSNLFEAKQEDIYIQ